MQSAALKLICDREDEINAFIPEEYWSLDAYLSANPALKPVCFHYAKDKVKKEELDQVKKEIDGKPFNGFGDKGKREDEETAASVYNKYVAAGSWKEAEFCNK